MKKVAEAYCCPCFIENPVGKELKHAFLSSCSTVWDGVGRVAGDA